MSEEIPVLVCLQVRESTIAHVVPGSIQGKCDSCSHAVWISRSGQAMMAAESIEIRCMACALAEMKDDPPKEVKAVPGAYDEIRAFLRRPDGSV